MRMRPTSSFIVMLFALIAFGCSNDDGVVEPNGAGKIIGKVTSSGGQIVAGAAISTVPATQSKTTGADGSFTIADVAPGTYVVTATKEGLNAAATSVAVGAGKTVTADIVMSSGPANGLPNEPSNPGPSDGSVAQPTELTLRWSASDPDEDTLRFDVLLGKTNPPTTVVTSNQLPRVHYIATLDSGTTYYWQVIARDNRGGVTSGPVWQFRTEMANENKAPRQPSGPSPSDGAINVASPVQLAWSSSDPEQDVISYDVYFGTTDSPNQVADDLTSPTLTRSNLAPNATYYWRVVARDNHGGETSSPLWRFTTGNSPEQPTGSLVAHYPLNGNAEDASGLGHHGTSLGATPTTDRKGAAGKAFYFNGNAYVSVPHSADLNFAGSFTIGAWIRLDQEQSNYTGIVAKGPEDTEYPGYMLLIMSGNVIGTATGQPEYTVITGQSNLDDGAWHYVTLVTEASTKTLSLYVDGVLERRETAPNVTLFFTSDRPLYIGVERNRDLFFKGSIDEVRLYSRALSVSEIVTLAKP